MSSQLPRLGMTGITGIAQMTPAAQSVLARASGGMRATRSGGGRKRNGTKKKRARKAAGAKRKNGGAKAWMVKGSAAAKRRMAQLRKMRK